MDLFKQGMFMSKSQLFGLAIGVAIAVTLSAGLNHVYAGDNSDDVFLDEGDGDFDEMPIPPQKAAADVPKEKIDGKKSKSAPAAVKAVVEKSADEASKVASEPIEKRVEESLDKNDTAPVIAEDTKTGAAKFEDEMPPEAKPNANAKAKTKANANAKIKKATAKEKKKIEDGSIGEKKAAGLFMTTKSKCPMMREQGTEGTPMFVVKAERKLWVEAVDQEWVKGFDKNGEPGYLSRNCF